MPLEEEEDKYDFQVVTDKPEPTFEDLAAAAHAGSPEGRQSSHGGGGSCTGSGI